MRQSIAYLISAAIHIGVVAVLLSNHSSPKEELLIALPEQLTIGFQLEAPDPTPTPSIKEQKKLTESSPIKKIPSPVPVKKAVSQVQPKPKAVRENTKKIEPKRIEQVQREQDAPTTTVATKSTPQNKPKLNKASREVESKAVNSNPNNAQAAIIHNPTFRRQSPIKYPRRAKQKKLQGTVILQAAIDSKGRVKKAWVHQSSGYAILDSSAMSSIKSWIFVPAQQSGSPVASVVQFPITFKLR